MSTSKNPEALAIFTVVYDQMSDYLDDFMASLIDQTVTVPVLIFNDNLDPKRIDYWLDKLPKHSKCIALSGNQGVSDNRIEMLSYCATSNYTWCLFIDSDDFMSKNRVEKTLKYLENCADILYNPIILFDETLYFDRPMPECVLSYRPLIDENFVGFSCITVRKSAIIEAMPFLKKGSQCIAYDWFLIVVLLMNGATAKRIPDCYTKYRLHERNTAGLLHLDRERYMWERKVKQRHYEALSLIDESFAGVLEEHMRTSQSIDAVLLEYIEYLNKKGQRFWWSGVDHMATFLEFQQEVNSGV